MKFQETGFALNQRAVAPYMSHLLDYSCAMNNRGLENTETKEEPALATFGEAELVRIDGRIFLRGGSMVDRIEAMEWMSIYMPEENVAIHR